MDYLPQLCLELLPKITGSADRAMGGQPASEASLDSLDLAAKLALLPDDVRELVQDLPEDKLASIIGQILQAAELSFDRLSEDDVAVIKVSDCHHEDSNACWGYKGVIM